MMALAIIATPSEAVNSIEICTNNINQTEIPMDDLYDSIRVLVKYIITKNKGRINMENDTRKQIVKQASLVAIDTVVAAFSPYLLLAWNFSKSMYGVGLQLRQKKALEWVEMISSNPEIFTETVLQSEEFQDGFVYALEQYIRERNEEKRKYYRNIFCNFANSKDMTNFEIERFYNSLIILNIEGLEALQRVNYLSTSSYVLYDDRENIEGVYNIIQAGIVALDTTARWASDNDTSPFVYTTQYGKRFKKFLKHEK